DNVFRNLGLRLQGKAERRIPGPEQGYFIGIGSETCAGIPQRVQYDQVQVFFLQLFLCILQLIGGFQRETNKQLSFFLPPSQVVQDVLWFFQFQGKQGVTFFDFFLREGGRGVIRYGCREDRHIAGRK